MTRWILVVEDEPPLGAMLCDNLQLEGYGTELVRDGATALERLAKGGLDLVVLDVMLPRVDGFDVLARMRAGGDRTPVLVLSARASDRDRIRGLELHADDYLTKPFNLRELLLRVHALLRRSAVVAAEPDTVSIAGHTVDFRARESRAPDGARAALSDSELKLLRLLVHRANEVVSRREILDHLFGPGSLSSGRTLDNLVLALRNRFETDNRNPRHFHTVRGIGFRFVP